MCQLALYQKGVLMGPQPILIIYYNVQGTCTQTYWSYLTIPLKDPYVRPWAGIMPELGNFV